MSTILHDWALRWGVSGAALHDLKAVMGLQPAEARYMSPLHESLCAPDPARVLQSEDYVQARVRLAHAAAGGLAWRNNRGAMTDGRRVVRYGLANDSHQLDKVVKSSDLVGIRPLLVEQRHVGATVGQFWCRECKPEGWVYTGTDREVAQLRWIELVLAAGGDAAFSTGQP